MCHEHNPVFKFLRTVIELNPLFGFIKYYFFETCCGKKMLRITKIKIHQCALCGREKDVDKEVLAKCE